MRTKVEDGQREQKNHETAAQGCLWRNVAESNLLRQEWKYREDGLAVIRTQSCDRWIHGRSVFCLGFFSQTLRHHIIAGLLAVVNDDAMKYHKFIPWRSSERAPANATET